MKIKYKYIQLMVLTLVVQSCQGIESQQTVTVYNDLDILRKHETVSIKKTMLQAIMQDNFENVQLKDNVSNQIIPVQFIDKDNDGIKDALLFQPEIAGMQSKKLTLYLVNNPSKAVLFDTIAYSRFVPERMDDYAWENDRVAFRVFGPKAEKLAINGLRGGVISSGVDCWLKRVEYPIINKWYKSYSEGTGDYHKDSGEGLDNFHVGTSRGCGGIAVWKDSILLTSKNYKEFSTRENGPIQTHFELKYGSWNMGDEIVSEIKKITLDKGSQLTRYELVFDKEMEGLVAGIPLEHGANNLTLNQKEGWFSLWKSHGDSELGLAIVVEPKYILNQFEYYTPEKDQSHLFVQLKPINNTVVYYAGFGWKKSEHFGSTDAWEAYLKEFSMRLKSPIRLAIN